MGFLVVKAFRILLHSGLTWSDRVNECVYKTENNVVKFQNDHKNTSTRTKIVIIIQPLMSRAGKVL